MATRDHTDADFNAEGLLGIEFKLAVYFDTTPIELTHADYIAQIDGLEELSADDTNPLGCVSANTLTIELLNTDNIFSPTNEDGPYFGKIKKGVKVIPYLRLVDATDTLNWIQLGVYYVSKWEASIDAATASVYAADKMQTIIADEPIEVQVVTGNSFKQFTEYYFNAIGYDITVDDQLTDIIPYAFAENKTGPTLTELMCAAKAACYSDRSGDTVVTALERTRDVRATLTDDDQIINISLVQSTLKTFDGVSFTYKFPQLLSDELLLDVSEVKIPVGSTTLAPISFDKGPAAALAHAAFQTEGASVSIESFSYTPWQITVKAKNATAAEKTTNLCVYGTQVKFTDTILSDETENMLSYTNKYIQTAEAAEAYKAFLNRFVSSDIPTLDVDIRGNLLLKIGDKIEVNSTRFKIAFTGIIKRQTYTYDGSLSSTLSLINTALLEEEG